MLADFDRIIPGLAERIVSLTERQVAHRISIEAELVRIAGRESLLGQVFGFILGAGGLSVGGWLAWLGKDLIGFAAVVGGLGSLLVAYLSRQKTEREAAKAKQ